MPHYQFVIHHADSSKRLSPCAASGLEDACAQALVMADDLAVQPISTGSAQPIGLDLCDAGGELIIGIGIVPGTPLAGAAARFAKRIA